MASKGRLFFKIFQAFAEFERGIIKERMLTDHLRARAEGQSNDPASYLLTLGRMLLLEATSLLEKVIMLLPSFGLPKPRFDITKQLIDELLLLKV